MQPHSLIPLSGAAAQKLVQVAQELALARELGPILSLVVAAAREVTQADGATFVLHEGTQAFYAEENAIAPLWKGRRIPLHDCPSGWVMLERNPLVIANVQGHPRVPASLYRSTFVRSLAIVPVGGDAPVAALGNYWAQRHEATPEELAALQALADSAAAALQNMRAFEELAQRLRARTAQWEVACGELHNFAHSLAHDLRAPVRHILGYTAILRAERGDPAKVEGHVQRINHAAGELRQLIDDMAHLAEISQSDLAPAMVNVTALAEQILNGLAAGQPQRKVRFVVQPDLRVSADPTLLQIALTQLLENAWKFTGQRAEAEIEVGAQTTGEGTRFFVRDNGAGFDLPPGGNAFQPFRRFHSDEEFPGRGIGLAAVARIIAKHGGSVSAASARGAGATISFLLPAQPRELSGAA